MTEETQPKTVYIEMHGNQFKPVPAYYLAPAMGMHWVLLIDDKAPRTTPIAREQYWESPEAFFKDKREIIAKKRKELDDWEKALDKEEQKK